MFINWLRGKGLWIIMVLLVALVLVSSVYATSVWGSVDWPAWFTLPISIFVNMAVIFSAMFGSLKLNDAGEIGSEFDPLRFFGSILLFLALLVIGLMLTV